MDFRIYPASYPSINGIIDNITEIPSHIERILSNTIAFLVAICFSLGLILAIVGIIQWATGWDERSGKKTVVKGIVLIAISLLAGGGVLAGYMLT
ncbi:MAG: hypothetical protein ACTSO7_01620 [Candidatus Heimdallarchaeota archaeon]